MCGICGIVSKSSDISEERALGFTEGMLAKLTHRGPDAQSSCLLDGINGAAFGHARLSIIDLSEAGNQPMRDRDGAVTLIVNGEIYNYQEIRATLLRKGYEFSSTSDSEVILHGYREYGLGVLDHLRGMYSMALYDKALKRIILSRDPLGIKPLYICETESFLAFASEINALLALPLPRDIDKDAVVEFLFMGCIKAPRTHMSRVKALMPGQTAIITDGRIALKIGAYIEDWMNEAAGSLPLEIPEMSDCLRDSVSRHLLSDAPIGVFLSGGIDSGTIAGLACESGHSQINGVCVTVPGNPLDESSYARMTAELYGIEMQEVPLDQSVFEKAVDTFFAHIDQPTCDGFNTFVVARAARQAGLKAALSGVGGDELFEGYPTFSWTPFFTKVHRLTNFMGRFSRKSAAGLLHLLDHSSGAERVAGLLAEGRADRRISYLAYRGLFVSPILDRLLNPELSQMAKQVFERFMDETRWATQSALPVSLAVSGLEIDRYMQPMLLRDSDVFSMAHGLELRTPLVDIEVLKTALPYLGSYNRGDGHPKPLLRESLSLPLPAAVVKRRKQGFTFPWQDWMHGYVMKEFDRMLNNPDHAAREILNLGGVSKIVEDFQNGHAHWRCLWSLFVLLRVLDDNRG